MDKMQQMTALARPLDPSYFTNRLILVLTPLLGVLAGVVTLIQSNDITQAFFAGLYMGASVFFAWVITREIDPDHDYAAFLAVAIVTIVTFFFSPTAIDWLGLIGLMMASRVVNRIVGDPCSLGDTVIIIVLSALVVFFALTPSFVLILAFALIFDGILEQPVRRHLMVGIVVFLAGIVGLAVVQPDFDIIIPDAPTFMWFGLGVVYAVAIWQTRTIGCQTDKGGIVSVRRVQATMLLPLIAGALALLTSPWTLVALLPIWSAMLAVPLYRLGVLIGLLRR